MELRVPGIGGPSPESVLGCERGCCVPAWRSERGARSMVRRVAGAWDVNVYDWRPLTSGSRSFFVWPLLLPFTLINVAGWMSPTTPKRRAVHQFGVLLTGWCATASCVIWLLVASFIGWSRVLQHHPAVLWWVSVATASVAMALVVLCATYTAHGFERYRPKAWRADAPSSSGARDLRNPRFYDNEVRHQRRWNLHVALAVSTMVAINVLVVRHGVAAPGGTLNRAIVFAQGAPFAAVLLVTLNGVVSIKRGAGLLGAGAAALGVMLLSGFVVSALTTVLGVDDLPGGPIAMTFDVFGATVIGIGLAAVVTLLLALQRPSTAERGALRPKLVPSLVAKYRARVATTVGGLQAVLVLCGLAVPIAACAALWVRWVHRADGELWRARSSSPAVAVASWLFALLLAKLVVNLVKTKANPDVLRQVGNIWDIVGFWPRSYHPFAVRPYAERAVPELRQYVSEMSPEQPVVIAAHSQGSVIAYAALLPETDINMDNVALVTFGSPLRSLYLTAFPAYVDGMGFQALSDKLGGRWINVYRCTDHVGQSVFDDAVTALERQYARGGAAAAVRDIACIDPNAPGSPVEGHSRYWKAPSVEDAVARMGKLWHG
jgi:hypothetical protein